MSTQNFNSDVAFSQPGTVMPATAQGQVVPPVQRVVSVQTTASFVVTGSVFYAGNNLPRIQSNGILVEPSSSNVVRQSQALASAPWSIQNAGGASVTASNNTTDVAAPDGTNTVTKLTFSVNNGAGAFNLVSLAVTGSAGFASGTNVCLSLYVMAATGTASYSNYAALVDNNNHVMGNPIQITGTANWQRFSSGPAAWSNTAPQFIYIGSFPGTVHGEGNTASGSLYVWGVQLEQQNYATSYMPTTTGTGSRGGELIALTNPIPNNCLNWSVGMTVTPISGANWNDTTNFQMLCEIGNSSGTFTSTNGTQVYFTPNTNKLSFDVHDNSNQNLSFTYNHQFATGSTHTIVCSNNFGALSMQVDGVNVAGTLTNTGLGRVTTQPSLVSIMPYDAANGAFPGVASNVFVHGFITVPQTDFQFAQGTVTYPVTGTSGAGIVLLPANPNRQGLTIMNDSPATLYLLMSGTSVTTANYTYQVPPNTFVESTKPCPTSALLGVWSSATGSAYCTEIS